MRRSRSDRTPTDPPSIGAGRMHRMSGLLALAVVVTFLAVTPPASSASGPASPEPPPSQLPVPTGPLFPGPSIDPLDQPSGAGAGVPAPEGIVGTWYSGTVSDIGYVDTDLGSYSSGGGEGLMYGFAPDGSWQYGWMLQSALYACEMRVMVYRTGVLSATDPATGMIQLDTLSAQMHSEDTCSEDGNYDKELPPDDETLIWVRTSDEYGDVLMLRAPDTDFSLFRPMDLG